MGTAFYEMQRLKAEGNELAAKLPLSVFILVRLRAAGITSIAAVRAASAPGLTLPLDADDRAAVARELANLTKE
ncbi:MAG TPA: hypothetical protein VK550_22665 [Polyangiaceae bacterium]|nr:hypothetical protein [Polyangiaceae bacterium]